MKKIIQLLLTGMMMVTLVGCSNTNQRNQSSTNGSDIGSTTVETKSAYAMSGNDLQEFDLSFMKIEDDEKNVIYSPLSIKYALAMLSEGTEGQTKAEIDSVIGTYEPNLYGESENMTFANAIFVDEELSGNVSEDYIKTIHDKFNAEVLLDTFDTPDKINAWVSDKTYHLISDFMDADSLNEDTIFVLLNALAIDMEWKTKIMSIFGEGEYYSVYYEHENYTDYISELYDENSFPYIEMNGTRYLATEFGATVNKYDIINVLGEDTVRQTLSDAYQEWLNSPEGYGTQYDASLVDRFIEELKPNYNQSKTSTDFSFYTDDYVKVFAKDLKEYNGTTLQYVAIMPVQESLSSYIENMDADSINKLINSLQSSVDVNAYEDGYVYRIIGGMPQFDYNYKLPLKEDLQKLGITTCFDEKLANLDGIGENLYVQGANHKATITLSNDGIKAAAVSSIEGGLGAAGFGFEYNFDVPVKTIDLIFNQPFMYLIRDTNTGEVWFAGKVYEPTEYTLDNSYPNKVGENRYSLMNNN